MKTKILLACAAGMSTSILVKRMDDFALDNDLDLEIKAVPVGDASRIGNDWNVVLIGPQTGFKLESMKEALNVPVAVIPTEIYATGKAEEAVNLALETIKNFKK